ncbi:MAG: InlB B-repeat-containing protein [Lachnospiraceae bacterium]|nr:InlB B-repeat-containing protein [Lachnospiraceae bacterium]
MKEKRRIRKGILSFALAVIMIFGTLTGILPGTSIKVKAENVTGEWSDGINYSYDTDTGVLTIISNGSTTVEQSTVVFNEYSGPDATINEPFSNISRIVISEGITAIGDGAFKNWYYAMGFGNNLTIVIPSTVTSIGNWAFSSITGYRNSVSVIMNARPGNITTFYTNAFNDSNNGEFITPYVNEWKESDKCSYDSNTNKITFDGTYTGTFTLSSVTYTVTFKDYDGAVLKTQNNVEYNTSATAPSDPTREHYTFTGWDKSFDNVTEDLVVTAQYEINKYTVTFKDYDGAVLKTQNNVEYNTSATAPTDPTREGYTFTGWDKSFTNITANTEVTAQYEINKYTVTFKDYNGNVLKTQENVEYNTSATAPAEPTRDGYTFTGWDKEFTNITEDTTVTATYSINNYTVTWTNYDDSVLDTDTVNYGETPEYTGDTPTKPADAQYTYTFVGWTPAIDTVTGNVTYKATYKETEIKKDNGKKDVSTEVKKDEKSPDLKSSDLTEKFAESTLTAEEQTLIEDALDNGDTVEIDVYLSINDISDDIAAADKAKVEALAADADQLEYFDISLYKEITIGGVSQGANPLQTLATPLKLTISVPKSFPAVASGYTRTYVVIRLHDGKAELLPATVNADGTISFETDKFSTYALAYTDMKEDTSETTTEATTASTTATTTAAASTSDATTASAKAEEKTAPKTGDSMPIAVLVVLMLSAAGALAFMDLKKKKN